MGRSSQILDHRVAMRVGGGMWDDETKTPWLHSPDGDQVIGYDDAESLRLKTAWANEHGLRGVFFGEIGADRLPDGSHPLQEAAHAEWSER